MSDHDRDEKQLPVSEVSAMGGGRVLVPDSSLIPKSNELSDPERDAEFDHEDDGLLDPGSPEFDHSLRRRKS